jgi:hypothetical protein
MSSDDAILDELREQTKWLRVLGLGSLRPLVTTVVKSDRDKVVYEQSNGERTARDVAKIARVTHPTVLRLWQDWLSLGICIESRRHPGRAAHVLPLSKLGLAVPKDAGEEATPGAPKPEKDPG